MGVTGLSAAVVNHIFYEVEVGCGIFVLSLTLFLVVSLVMMERENARHRREERGV